ncbi:Hint domain-containing protein [Actibacterium sp. D379-3]
MTQDARAVLAPSYSAHVFSAEDVEVVSGANLGDPLMSIDELCLGDVYELHPDAEPLELMIRDAGTAGAGADQFLGPDKAGHMVAEESEVGQPGEALTLEGRLTFMAPDGGQVVLALIGHRPHDGDSRALFFLPLTPIEPREQYTLLSADPDPGDVRLSDITPVAFTRGTLITLADGTQRAIEDLRPGDKVLTRDHGPQPVRWIGQRTVRAIGPFAPVVITKGTLSNESDLIVSQHQRLFLYQRSAARVTKTAEVLVKARDLVDDETVFIRKGGFVEYFHLIFDRHEIIYAEYTPTESLLINGRSLGRLSEELQREVEQHLPDLSQEQHFGTEADKALLDRIGPDMLRRTKRDN